MFEAYSHSNHEGLIAASCIEKEVRFGSWLCENAKTLNGDRRSYSSKTVLASNSQAH